MASNIVTEDEEGRRSPLLVHSANSAHGDEEEIAPSSSNEPDSPIPDQRLLSLDVFRGLSIALLAPVLQLYFKNLRQQLDHLPGYLPLMILVDDAGGAIPSINHSPWSGVTLADFVMPFFLFGVGVSICLVYKKMSSKLMATKKVILRFIKLFLLGILLQGGFFHGRHHLTYGVDVRKIRWLGVLQRISIGYLMASMSEIWLVNNVIVDSPMTFVRKYYRLWIVAVSICVLYVSLLYGLYVPDWEFEFPTSTMSSHGSGTQTVHCGLRGNLEPPCNAIGFIDRILLGEDHLYQRPVYRRTKQCSVNSPDYGPLPPNSPAWCLAPFDPEGVLSSLMAAVTCFVGLHFGHILLHFKDNMHRIFLWSISSFSLLISGYALELFGIPLCKPLYTLSYMCITAGVSGLCLTAFFYAVDIKNFRKPTMLLQWMGMNALIIYALAACDIFPAVVQGFYWRSPGNNLVDGTESLLQVMLHSRKWGTLMFVILEIIFWGFVAGFLHMKRICIKL